MAEININNYEAFFLDYHEGNLSAEQVAALLLFVEQHSELKAQLDEFENVVLSDYESVEYLDKGALKKGITAVNKNDFYIAKVENTLSPVEEQLLDSFLKQNPAERKEVALFYKTKLQPDTAIVFENKAALKHKAGVVITMYYAIAVAASVVLLLGLFFLNKNDDTDKIAVLPVTQIKQSEKPMVEEMLVIPAANNSELIAITRKQEKKYAVKGADNKEGKLSEDSDSIIKSAITEEPMAAVVEQSNKDVADTLQRVILPALVQQQVEQITPNNTTSNRTQNSESDYTSLRELAAEKVKEKLLDKTSLEEQRKAGRSKKINGWDIAQMLTKGVSKISGRDMELKPTYDDNGNVTAYAFNAGKLHISRGQ